MTNGFEQQQSPASLAFTKSLPAPQHGQKADDPAKKVCERRSFEPRPAH